jgi:hypothetical protein
LLVAKHTFGKPEPNPCDAAATQPGRALTTLGSRRNDATSAELDVTGFCVVKYLESGPSISVA